ncbi:unnamed protein product [Effrenium voratum]|nr:unnamed protein product [Effrenium voratum]
MGEAQGKSAAPPQEEESSSGYYSYYSGDDSQESDSQRGTQANAATRSNDGTKEPDDEDGASTAHKQKEKAQSEAQATYKVMEAKGVPAQFQRACQATGAMQAQGTSTAPQQKEEGEESAEGSQESSSESESASPQKDEKQS